MQRIREYDLIDAEEIINESIDAYMFNVNQGIVDSAALSLIGPHGLGKTELPMQIAKKRGMDFVKINVGEIDELGALMGYPTKIYQFAMKVNNEIKYVNIDKTQIARYEAAGFKRTKKPPRMTYAAPEWLDEFTSENGGIFYLDDYSRALPFVLQAIMQLLDKRTYGNWKLPDNVFVLASENPDNGEYQVTGQDDAHDDRKGRLYLKYSPAPWMNWAENHNIDSRCINFMHIYPEVVTGIMNEDYEVSTPGYSPRKWTKFFRSINIIRGNYHTDGNLIRIKRQGEMYVPEHLLKFISFIHNKEDQYISPEQIFNIKTPTSSIIDSLHNMVYPVKGTDIDENGNAISVREYRSDVSAMMSIRIKNYLLMYCKDNRISHQLLDRVEDVIINDKKLFTQDSIFNMLKSITSNKKYNGLMMRPSIISILTKDTTLVESV